LRVVHGTEKVQNEVSLHHVTSEIRRTHHGMMIAIGCIWLAGGASQRRNHMGGRDLRVVHWRRDGESQKDSWGIS
jgi:hypothetical protein